MSKLLKLTTAIAGALVLSTAYAQHADMPRQTINVGVQQHIVKIALPANATTGYQWYVSNYNTDLLTLSSYKYVAPQTRRVGAGGTAEFEFTVKPGFHVAPQITDVTFVYGQSWDMNGATSKVIALTSIPVYSPSSSPEHSTKKSASSRKMTTGIEHSDSVSHSSSMTSATEPANAMPAVTPSPAPAPATMQETPSADTTPASPSSNTSNNPANSWLAIPGQS